MPVPRGAEDARPPIAEATTGRRFAAELIGTALLLIAVVGSGIAADRLTDDGGLTLVIHAVVVGAALAAIIVATRSISGAHLNPAVTLGVALEGGLAWRRVPAYVVGQLIGGVVGAIAANLMFGLPGVSIAATARTGGGLWVSEFIATFGLLAVIWTTARHFRGAAFGAAVGAYVTGAIMFSSSGSFANPAVTVARTLSDTFTGIAPNDVAPFVAAQFAAAIAATVLFRWLIPGPSSVAD